MTVHNQHIDIDAQNSLENTRRAQAEKKLAMVREEKTRELKQLETQLYYKNQEVARLKTLFDRLRREAVTRQSTELKEERDVAVDERQFKDTETRLQALEGEVKKSLTDIAEKIAQEKAVLAEHQKKIEALEKQKRETENKTNNAKRALTESLSRFGFYKKKEEREATNAKKLFDANQAQLHQIEHSLKSFTQETTVLENKIRALRSAFK